VVNAGKEDPNHFCLIDLSELPLAAESQAYNCRWAGNRVASAAAIEYYAGWLPNSSVRLGRGRHMSDSSFLCLRPSFLEGVARILDFPGTLSEYNRSLTAEQADYLALLADWQLVGKDIQEAIQTAPGTEGRPKPR
jgi:hypothetical protein